MLTNREILKFGAVNKMSDVMHNKNRSFQNLNTPVFAMIHTAGTTISI